jgi:hypothetical protein
MPGQITRGNMPYKVFWRKLPGRAIIREETFETLDEAMDDADIAQMSGSSPVEVTVVDDTGVQHFIKVHG